MNFNELQSHVARGESEQLEFKKSTGDLRGGMESLCGFLNGLGGRVCFGVNSSGRIVGQNVSDSTSQEVARELRKFEPAADVRQHIVELPSGMNVFVLETGDRSQAPYTFDGRAFQRVGTTTSLMPQEEYQRRLLERGHSQQRWENQAACGYAISDLDEEEIARTVTEALSARRLDSPATSAPEVLRRLKLADDNGVTQAAVVAFAKEVLPGYPQCALRMARFRGTGKDEFLDQRQITGHAFKLLDEAMLFLSRHLPVAGRFEPGVITRIDEPLFPTLALREAVVNALCHRDYAIVGGSISIAVYDDRLEITSTGTLPFGLTVEDLKRDHVSRPRNPLLAEVFYRRGLIERWGRGTQKIVALCVEAGHPEPEFEERAGDLVVRFLPSGYVPPHRVDHDLSERQRRILFVLGSGRKLRAREILAEVDDELPPTTLRAELAMLRSLGLVDGSGRGPGARWWLKRLAR